MPQAIDTQAASKVLAALITDARTVLGKPPGAVMPEDALDALLPLVECVPVDGWIEYFDPDWYACPTPAQTAETADCVARLDALYAARVAAMQH